MFTGLVQGLGTVQPIGRERFALSVLNQHSQAVAELAIGDSVAVDGVCLTVEEFVPQGFIATASPETLKRTTLGRRSQAAATVNLEASLRVGSKLGGHFVTGHVDGLGCLAESVAREQAWEMIFAAPPSLSEQWQQSVARYLIPKGSIGVNGISLTVAECASDASWFKVAVIPVTYAETNLHALKIGDLVNLESDILGKYVDKLLRHRLAPNEATEEISLSFLAENGYL